MAGFGPFCIFLASFVNPNAYWKLGWFDYACGAVAVFALILWKLTNSPVNAIIFAITADALALLPTLIKAWRFPQTETGLTFILALLNVCLGIAFSNREFSEMAFLLYLFVADATLVVAIYRKRLFRQKGGVA